MSAIIISADTEDGGKALAVETASLLEYRYLGANLLTSVAEQAGITAEETARVFKTDSVNWLSPPKKLKETVTLLQQGIIEVFLEDAIVCEGFFAHLFLSRVPHVLNVRVLVDLEVRQQRLAEEKGVSLKKARAIVDKQDKARRRWSEKLFGVNEADPSLYDLLIPLGKTDEERATKLIADRAASPQFQPTTYSRRCIEDQLVASKVRAALAAQFARVEVAVKDGDVVLQLAKGPSNWRKAAEEMKSVVSKVEGVGSIQVRKGRSSLVPA